MRLRNRVTPESRRAGGRGCAVGAGLAAGPGPGPGFGFRLLAGLLLGGVPVLALVACGGGGPSGSGGGTGSASGMAGYSVRFDDIADEMGV